MKRKQAVKHLNQLVHQLVARNQAEAARIAAMGFRLDQPTNLVVFFRTATYAHASALRTSLTDLGFSTRQVTFDNRYWNITSTIKLPVAVFISEPFTHRLATMLVQHHGSLRTWQKQYL